MTWVIHYNKSEDKMIHDLVFGEYQENKPIAASVIGDVPDSDVSVIRDDHEGHRWIMDTGCGSDLISKAKVEDNKLRRSRASNPIQFQTANGNRV